eukprot:1159940-Pelagomonas_calceolata.AAC.4
MLDQWGPPDAILEFHSHLLSLWQKARLGLSSHHPHAAPHHPLQRADVAYAHLQRIVTNTPCAIYYHVLVGVLTGYTLSRVQMCERAPAARTSLYPVSV